MESEGEGGFIRGLRDGIDRAQKVLNSPLGNSHERERRILDEKKVLSEPNVKVVFHQTAVPVTPLSTWIIYPKRSALGHSTRCLAEAWLSQLKWILSFLVDAEPAAPLTKKGADALHGPLPFCCCQRFPGPRYKGQATKAAIPIGLRAERGEGPAIK